MKMWFEQMMCATYNLWLCPFIAIIIFIFIFAFSAISTNYASVCSVYRLGLYASSVFHFIFKCLPTLSLSITIEGLYVVVVLSFIIAKSFLVNTALQHNSNVPLRHFSIDRRYRGWFVQRSYSKFSISSNRECFAPNYCPSAQNSFPENWSAHLICTLYGDWNIITILLCENTYTTCKPCVPNLIVLVCVFLAEISAKQLR